MLTTQGEAAGFLGYTCSCRGEATGAARQSAEGSWRASHGLRDWRSTSEDPTRSRRRRCKRHPWSGSYLQRVSSTRLGCNWVERHTPAVHVLGLGPFTGLPGRLSRLIEQHFAEDVNLLDHRGFVSAQRRVREALLEDLLFLGIVLLVTDANKVSWSVNNVRWRFGNLFDGSVHIYTQSSGLQAQVEPEH